MKHIFLSASTITLAGVLVFSGALGARAAEPPPASASSDGTSENANVMDCSGRDGRAAVGDQDAENGQSGGNCGNHSASGSEKSGS